MNFSAFERAQVAGFAYGQARSTGSLDCLKAVCYVLRNRIKAGWGQGTWLDVIGHHPMVAGNEEEAPCALDPGDRLLQLLVRDIDDIYLGQSEDDTRTVVQDALYFQFVNRPARQWFVDNIVRQPNHHARIAQVGPMALFR